ncbi:emp24/gp25L/p24 family/GOLD-domain-containing protein [Corynascus novoguineensis]|uniref:Emp24/gp25L/p24 family/GOLD-domain-containing protein n=1 Tax=Corynascus novoguineensis TaxID=1126955 RepID=A0AAN7CTF4_9PEZI|nr:emp24/gp25L/p24 family/GOLD-domain-containing protein [Corynascus novoguineensis]
MFLRTAAKLLLSASLLLSSAMAHNIQLPAHGRECFHENLHSGDKMTVTFQVGDREFGSAGNLDIDFWITNPAGGYETNDKSVSNGDFTFNARHDGKYVYCFGNEHWGASSKEVSFNVHGIVYVSEADQPQDPLEVEVRKMSDVLERVKDEQAYIVVRERTHRNTAESTNSRVKWWNIFVIGVVIGESIFQVWWLRRFFEVKRVV